MAPSTLPDVALYENAPDQEVKITEVFAGKKGILIAVPGAFTPGCSQTHLPGYITNYDKFKEAGAEVIVCVSVNDPFVMAAWAKDQGADGKVRVLADTNAVLTKALGAEMDAPPLGGTRSRRYSAIIVDNEIKHFNLEEGGAKTCSLADPTLEQLKALQ